MWTRRKSMIVDPRMQGALVLRVVAYWFFSLIAIGLILLAWDIAQGPWGPFSNPARLGPLWEKYCSVVLASLLILPVLVVDTVLVSGRFAGPLYRVRGQMRALAAGEPVEPIRFRKSDSWSDVARDFNAIVERMAELDAKQRAGAKKPNPCQEQAVDLETADVG